MEILDDETEDIISTGCFRISVVWYVNAGPVYLSQKTGNKRSYTPQPNILRSLFLTQLTISFIYLIADTF